MNTNQRIEASKAFNNIMFTTHSWGRMCSPLTVPDFIRKVSDHRQLPAVFHRISRGWTARDWLIEHRNPSQEIPF